MAASDRPHIILFLSDQHSPYILGSGGDPYIQTPAMDRLADEGLTFTNCYTPFPLCTPARMSFLTGRRCHEIGVWDNDDSLDSNIPTFAHGLGLAGYRTVLAGRMHFVGGDQLHGFQERPIGDVTSPHLGINRSEDRFRGYFGAAQSLPNAGPGRTVDQEYDTAVAMQACDVIRRHEVSGDERPLCLVVGFYMPHDPYRCYREYYDMYIDSPDLPADRRGESLHPLFHRRRDRMADGLTEDHIRRARAAYRGRVTYLDLLIGRVLETLDESPLSENALRIYTSDHGEMLGEHGLWTKACFYEAAGRVPLLMGWPGRLPAGETRSAPVELNALAPSLVDVGGGPALPHTDGRTLWPLATGQDDGEGKIALGEIVIDGVPARTVRQGRWKFNHYVDHPDELFDLQADPHELVNRASDPDCADVRQRLEGHVFSDGWDPQRIVEARCARKADYAYVSRWGSVTYPASPWQWGLPAPL